MIHVTFEDCSLVDDDFHVVGTIVRSLETSSPAESPKSVLRRKRFRFTLARPRAPATPMEINVAGGFRRVAKVFDQPHLRSGYLDAEGDAPQLTSKEI